MHFIVEKAAYPGRPHACRFRFEIEGVTQKAAFPEEVTITPLYLLLPYDLRASAKSICCHQDIAANSCFADSGHWR